MDYFDALRHFLANTYALAVKTQVYHWHIKGNTFMQDHAFLGDLYENLLEAVDDIAERLRMQDQSAHITFASLDKMKALSDPLLGAEADIMFTDLSKDQHTLIDEIKGLITKASKEGDEGTADFLVGRLRYHEKSVWFIDSKLG